MLPLAAAALLAAACFGSDAAEPTSTPPTASSMAPAVTATAPASGIGDPEIDGDRALEHVRMLAEQIGPRVSGTPAEIEARDYIAQTLESYGYDVELQEFPFDATAFRPARADVAGVAVPAFSVQGSPGGTVQGPVVEAGIGRPEELPPTSSGAVALIRRGDLTFREKVENAAAAGAVAVIIYNNEPGRLLANAEGDLPIPAIGISGSDGDGVLSLLDAGVEAEVFIPERGGTAYNVVAKPDGITTCETVTGGHYDSVAVTGGADDNASGSASVLELARVAAAQQLDGANCFALFGAEEFGLFGSKWFVQQLSADEQGALRAMINIDVVGLPEPLQLIGSDDLVEVARIVASDAGIDARPGEVPAGASSDHASFAAAGIPVVFLNHNDPLIHTPQDAIGRIDPDSLGEAVQIALGTLRTLNRG
jgi:hypothetical protein